MRSELKFKRLADDVFECPVGSPLEAQNLARVLRASRLIEDAVPGLNRVAVTFEPDRADDVQAWLDTLRPTDWPASEPSDTVELDIAYGGADGPDLEAVCATLGLSQTAFIAQHTAQTHTVEMLGFTPGFAYISGLSDAWSLSRLSDPRPRVPAGSVGISGRFTGVYALAGPGGWPLIGRTAAALFEADRDPPFLLHPGQHLRFRSV
ncbi:MAG: allophanate hydrolase subunit 1 [Pseudomonadota bacterium]